MNGYSIGKTFVSHLCMRKVVSAKNHFSGAGALMCVTRERYGLSQSGLQHYVQRRVHFTMVSISRYVKTIASGRPAKSTKLMRLKQITYMYMYVHVSHIDCYSMLHVQYMYIYNYATKQHLRYAQSCTLAWCASA